MTIEIDFVIKNLFLSKLKGKKLNQFCQVNAGMIIHGPPGTGKTNIAEGVGKVWRKYDPKLEIRHVRGPELFDSYVGNTEEKIRDLFKDAIENLEERKISEAVPLTQHLIIVDEIDAMFGLRGGDSST